jgi:predicted TIM-barrel fold metal-dependent hydrolase
MNDVTQSRNLLGVRHAALDFAMPAGACDCHTHVFGPATRFGFDPARRYTPGDAVAADLLSHQRLLGLDRVVIVQPSPYGSDNACTVDGMVVLGPAMARGVAVIDADTTDAALAAMHAAGMRGARVNLETAGQSDPAAAAEALRWTAGRVAPLGWHVQTFTRLAVIEALETVLASLPVPLVVDHFGHARAEAGTAQPGFGALLRLLGSGRAYVKLSAPHRIAADPDGPEAASLARALVAANPERALWGSDWPHPGGRPGARPPPEQIEPFNPVDDGRALNRLARWAGDDALLHRILVANPAHLYDFAA